MVAEELGIDSFKVIDGDGPIGEISGFSFEEEIGLEGCRGGRRIVMPVFPGTRTLKLVGTLGFSGLGTFVVTFLANGAAGLTEFGGTTFLAVAGSSNFT